MNGWLCGVHYIGKILNMLENIIIPKIHYWCGLIITKAPCTFKTQEYAGVKLYLYI